MTGGQIAALGCAIALLLPGGCFLLLGLSTRGADGLTIGINILVVSAVLFWVALRRRPQTPAPPPPDQEP
jgi:hypothetical protein